MWCKTCGAIRQRCDCRLSSLTDTQPTREQYERIVISRILNNRPYHKDDLERMTDAYIRDMNTECMTEPANVVRINTNMHYPYGNVQLEDNEVIDVYLSVTGVSFGKRDGNAMQNLTRAQADKLGRLLQQASTFRVAR